MATKKMVFKLTIEKKDPDMGKPRAKVLRQRKEQGGKTLRGRMNLVTLSKGKASISKQQEIAMLVWSQMI